MCKYNGVFSKLLKQINLDTVELIKLKDINYTRTTVKAMERSVNGNNRISIETKLPECIIILKSKWI